MTDKSLEGVARDASTIMDVLGAFEHEGYGGQFVARAAGQIQCMTCKQLTSADMDEVVHLRRLEGASDPDDMLVLVALVCSSCGTKGTLLLSYGASASAEDSEVLRRLAQPPPPAA